MFASASESLTGAMTNEIVKVPPFRRVAILGTGLIGGSFGLALRTQFPEIAIVGYARAESSAAAVTRGAVAESTSDIATAVRGG